MSDFNSKLDAAQKELASVQAQVEQVQKSKRDQLLGEAAAKSSSSPLPSIRSPPSIKQRRALKGHFGKVTAAHWSTDSVKLVSASQDGNLLVWNALSNNKMQSIALKSSYVMSVGMEPTKGNLVACGGLDNLCTVYPLASPNRAVEMASHDGYLSCCRFIDEGQIITASGDSTCIQWDVASAKPIATMAEHSADVTFLALQPNTPHVFVSSSVDGSCKLWDVRSNPSAHAVQSYSGFHTNDVNGVDFMPSNAQCFVSAGQDNTVRVYDMRAYNQVAVFSSGRTTAAAAPATANGAEAGAAGGAVAGGAGDIPDDGFTSVSMSKSGRLIVCGHTDGSLYGFDILSKTTGTPTPSFVMAQAHERRISSVGFSPAGDAICTTSWDGLVKIWA